MRIRLTDKHRVIKHQHSSLKRNIVLSQIYPRFISVPNPIRHCRYKYGVTTRMSSFMRLVMLPVASAHIQFPTRFIEHLAHFSHACLGFLRRDEAVAALVL